jgi:hypothetical protein
MRARLTLMLLAAAAAACRDNEPAAPAAPDTRPTPSALVAPRASGASAAVFCPSSRIYPLTENTWELAATSVNGHSLPGVASDGGTFDYSLDITPEIASDLQRSAVAGCLAEVRFVTGGDVGRLGSGQASFSASTRVQIRAFATGGNDISKTFRDGYKAPPLPAGCTTIVCTVAKERIVVIPTTIQSVFQPAGRITVHSDATAHVNAGGTSVWDQALSSFSIPHGSGRHPDGPLLVVTFP